MPSEGRRWTWHAHILRPVIQPYEACKALPLPMVVLSHWRSTFSLAPSFVLHISAPFFDRLQDGCGMRPYPPTRPGLKFGSQSGCDGYPASKCADAVSRYSSNPNVGDGVTEATDLQPRGIRRQRKIHDVSICFIHIVSELLLTRLDRVRICDEPHWLFGIVSVLPTDDQAFVAYLEVTPLLTRKSWRWLGMLFQRATSTAIYNVPRGSPDDPSSQPAVTNVSI